MRGRSLLYMDVQSANLRSAFAHPQGRMPGGRAFRGVLSLVTFFAQAKKVTRSAKGRVEALLYNTNSKSKVKMDSGFRRNDKKGAMGVTARRRRAEALHSRKERLPRTKTASAAFPSEARRRRNPASRDLLARLRGPGGVPL